MIFGLSLWTEFATFTRMLGSKSATILSGRLFTPTFSMHEKSEFLSWVADLSTEVSFLNHLVKLEFLLRLELKTSMFTLGVPTLLGLRIFLSPGVQLFQIFLSTCTLLHAMPVTIAFNLIVLSVNKIFRETSTRELSWTFVTISCPMTPTMAGSKSSLTDNLRILSKMLISSFGSLLGSTCSPKLLIVFN